MLYSGEVLYSLSFGSVFCLYFILYVCFSSTIFPGWADFTEHILATAQSREKSKDCQLKIIINKIHGTCHNSRIYRKKYMFETMKLPGKFFTMRLDETTCTVSIHVHSTHTNLTWPTNLWERVYFSISITDAFKNYPNMVYVGSLSPFCSCYSPSYYYLEDDSQ